MKSLFKKFIISGFVLSLFATVLSLGIFLQPKKETFAYAPGSCTTLEGFNEENYIHWGFRESDGGQFEDSDYVWNITITNRLSSLPSQSNGLPAGYAYSFDVTGSPNTSLGQPANTDNLTCYVYDISENNVVTHQDIYIYADVETIYAPSDCIYLFSSGEGPYPVWADEDECISLLHSIIFESFDTSYTTSMYWMFWGECGCPYLTTINGLDVWNSTANVTDMEMMFNNCWEVTYLDVSGFDTSNVTNMDAVFSGCSSLTLLDVSNWDTSNVTKMGGLFGGCSSLTSLDLSRWDTSNVTRMNTMFYSNSSLEELNLDGINTSNLSEMHGMFYGCSSLTTIDMSSWDLSSVTDCSNVFTGCENLTTIYLPQELGNHGGDIELPTNNNKKWDYDGAENKNKTTLGSFYDDEDNNIVSDGETKRAIYASSVPEQQRTYEQPRTAETGVFVDVILPIVFVLIVSTLAVMYLKEGKKKKFIIR